MQKDSLYIDKYDIINHKYYSVLPTFDLQACSVLQILRYVEKALNKEENISADIAALFHGDLNPVAPKAQKKVAVPEGLVATLAANCVNY